MEDVALAAYIDDPGHSSYALEDVTARYIFGKKVEGAEAVDALVKIFCEYLRVKEQDTLYKNLELPVAKVLAQMEFNGIKPDMELLDQLAEDMSFRIKKLEKTAIEQAGEDFNLKSPKQLGVVLFEHLGLPVIKKTKTGYSTDVKVLEELEGKQTECHIGDGVCDSESYRLCHPSSLLRAVIEGNYRNDSVIETEYRHKDEALELEVDSERVLSYLTDRLLCSLDERCKAVKHSVEHYVHDRSDRCHNYRGNTDGVYFADYFSVGTEFFERELNVGVIFYVEEDAEDKRRYLTDNGCYCRSLDAHA